MSITARFQHCGSLRYDSDDDHFAHDENIKSLYNTHLYFWPECSIYSIIEEEWETLPINLPNDFLHSIYVRIHDRGVKHFRAAIVGPSDTPYHDALFFFNISLPLDYPKQPPNVYFHSHGLTLNPNLRSSGKVCLIKEKWSPTSKSSIHQLLASLQHLLLNKRDFIHGYRFNYCSCFTPEKNSMEYIQNVFILSCKHVMYTIRNPPKDFEDLVVEHYRSRGRNILDALKAYGDGMMIVGSYQQHDKFCCTTHSSRVEVSESFKKKTKKVYGELEKLLKEKGMYVVG